MIVVYFCAIAVIISLIHFKSWIFWLFLGLFILILSHILSSLLIRICPECNNKMKADLSNGYLPEAYYCSNCKVYCKTGVKNDNQ